MPIPIAQFQAIEESEPLFDLSPDTTQGAIYRFLLENAEKAFRQHEIVDAVDVSQESVGLTLACLEGHGVVDHRAQYWTIADAEHAVASASHLAGATADARDGGFSEDEVAAWMETAVDPSVEE